MCCACSFIHYLSVYLFIVCVFTSTHHGGVCKVGDNFKELIFFFHHVDSRGGTKVGKLGASALTH